MNSSFCHCRFRCTISVIFYRRCQIGSQSSLVQFAALIIWRIRYTHTACFIIRFVFLIFPAQSASSQSIFILACSTTNHSTFQIGIFFDRDIKAFFSGTNTCLVDSTFVIAMNVIFADATTDTGLSLLHAIVDRQPGRAILLFIVFSYCLVSMERFPPT